MGQEALKKSVRVIKSQFVREHLQNKQGGNEGNKRTTVGKKKTKKNSAERSLLLADLC